VHGGLEHVELKMLDRAKIPKDAGHAQLRTLKRC